MAYSSSSDNPLTIEVPIGYYLSYYAECDGYITSTSTEIQILENKEDINIYLEENYVSSVEVSNISLSYNSYTLSDTTTTLTPTLTYTLTRTWASGDTDTITSGATATWEIIAVVIDTGGNIADYSDYFSIDSSGNVTAGSETNYSSQVSATVTVTISYDSYTLTNNTTAVTVYRTATEDSVASTVWSSGSLSYSSYLDGTSYTDGDSISPELSYSFIDTYLSGTTKDVTSGATIVWNISDTTNFSIDTSGNVTALSDNYSSTKTATVTATITYNSISFSLAAYVTQTAATDSVASVEVSSISLTYYSDEGLTTVGSTLYSSVTTLYPKVIISASITYNSGDTDTVSYDSSSSSNDSNWSVSLSYAWNDSTTCMNLSSTGQVTYRTGILLVKVSGEVILTVDATYDNVENTGDNEWTGNVYAQIIAGTLYVEASEYPDDGISYTLTWDSSEMTLMQDSYYTSGTSSDTITAQATYGCFMNVSDWSEGYSIKCTFTKPDGYSITSTNPDSGTITAGNITTLSATLKEEKTVSVAYTITFYFQVTSNSQLLEDQYYFYKFTEDDEWSLVSDDMIGGFENGTWSSGYDKTVSTFPTSGIYIGSSSISSTDFSTVSSLGSIEVGIDKTSNFYVYIYLDPEDGSMDSSSYVSINDIGK